MRSHGARLALLLALALAAAACGGGEEEGGTITLGGNQANDHGSEDVSGESEVEYELDDFYFEPTVLSGSAGQELTLDLFNEGDQAHTFTVDALGVDVELQPEQRKSVKVTLADSGALLVYCRFHASQGMRAALSVGGDLTLAPGSGGMDGSGGYGGYGN